MKLPRLALLALGIGAADAFYTMHVYAPQQPQIDDKVINARGQQFVIGAPTPDTYCDLDNRSDCPAGVATLVDASMTSLAASVPGGQFVYVAPDGAVSYPSAHSALRPPGSQMGGFYASRLTAECIIPLMILGWQSDDGSAGLWACPTAPGTPISQQAILKASTKSFEGFGCLPVEGIQLVAAGSQYGAWAYY